MRYWLLHWLVSGTAVLLTSYLVPGFRVRNFGQALLAALVIGIVNFFVGPFLLFITFPLTILTLGLFIFVVDAVILKISAALLSGFDIDSWWSAIFGALILALVSMGLHSLLV